MAFSAAAGKEESYTIYKLNKRLKFTISNQNDVQKMSLLQNRNADYLATIYAQCTTKTN